MVKFWNAASANRWVDYDRYMAEIRDLDEGAFKWIEDILGHRIRQMHLQNDGMTCTTNVAECMNSFLKDSREYPITKQVEAIWCKLMEFYEVRHCS